MQDTIRNGAQRLSGNGAIPALLWEISVRAQNWIIEWLSPTEILSAYIRSPNDRPTISPAINGETDIFSLAFLC